MKQNTVLAAVSIGLFLALILTNLDNGKDFQDTSVSSAETKTNQEQYYANDPLPLVSEENEKQVIPQETSEDGSEMAMERDEWWSDTKSTDRLTEEEMVEMLESLWGPSNTSETEDEQKMPDTDSDNESEKDGVFDTEDDSPDIILEDSETKPKETSIGKSLTASILALDSDNATMSNKAELITRGGTENQMILVPDDPQNLTKDDVSSVSQQPSVQPEKSPEKPKPIIIESSEKPRPAIPETTDLSTKYADGTYSATGRYKKGKESYSFVVTFSIKNDRVENFSLSSKTTDTKEKDIQSVFYNNVHPYIIGEFLANIPQFSSLGEGSQGPVAFHSALTSIRSQASR